MKSSKAHSIKANLGTNNEEKNNCGGGGGDGGRGDITCIEFINHGCIGCLNMCNGKVDDEEEDDDGDNMGDNTDDNTLLIKETKEKCFRSKFSSRNKKNKSKKKEIAISKTTYKQEPCAHPLNSHPNHICHDRDLVCQLPPPSTQHQQHFISPLLHQTLQSSQQPSSQQKNSSSQQQQYFCSQQHCHLPQQTQHSQHSQQYKSNTYLRKKSSPSCTPATPTLQHNHSINNDNNNINKNNLNNNVDKNNVNNNNLNNIINKNIENNIFPGNNIKNCNNSFSNHINSSVTDISSNIATISDTNHFNKTFNQPLSTSHHCNKTCKQPSYTTHHTTTIISPSTTSTLAISNHTSEVLQQNGSQMSTSSRDKAKSFKHKSLHNTTRTQSIYPILSHPSVLSHTQSSNSPVQMSTKHYENNLQQNKLTPSHTKPKNQTHINTQSQKHTHTNTQSQKHTHTNTQSQKHTHTNTQSQKHTHTNTQHQVTTSKHINSPAPNGPYSVQRSHEEESSSNTKSRLLYLNRNKNNTFVSPPNKTVMHIYA